MDRINLNDGWKYSDRWQMKMTQAEYDDGSFEEVRLPHTVAVTPLNYFDESIYQKVCCYRRTLVTKDEWHNKRLLLTIDGAAHEAELFVNGRSNMVHRCGYTAFTTDITDSIRPEDGAVNYITIRLSSCESLNVPPFGKVVDYMTYGGIYRGVYLEIKEQDSINDVFITASGCREGSDSCRFKSVISLNMLSTKLAEKSDRRYEIRQSICDADGRTVRKNSMEWIPFTMKSSGKKTETEFDVSGVKCWNVNAPAMYVCVTELWADGVKLDEKQVRFGFREVGFRADGFYLNGAKVKIRGLNRHQSFPYVGYAMPDRLQREDAEILKYELGVNAVRCSHYPQSQAFVDRCDELGLLVFMEFPGWQYIGDERWKEQACDNLREMVLLYRNHPSIFLWGVRINESQDDDEFYTKTNSIAHELDPSRPTGGVRFLQKSHLLEDVYTYNDFSHTGKNAGASQKKDVSPDENKGYLISEYNGHMYPSKNYDDELHRTEHARRHLAVLNEVMHQQDIAGSFGWCMFDYNTHRDFGSGDRICYHGVMDMFRNAKQAAYVYASQSDDRDVFEISSTMDIGEYAGGHLTKVYAYTNADSVKLYKNDEFIREFFPDRRDYAYLRHPPVIIDDFIGCLIEHHEKYTHDQAEELKKALRSLTEYGMDSLPLKAKLRLMKLMLFDHLTMAEGTRLYYKYLANWGEAATTYRFEAIKGGQAVKQIIKAPVTSNHLEIRVGTGEKASHYFLSEAETYDAEAVRLRMLDQNGNLMPYFDEPVKFMCSGCIKLVGPDIISLKGGMGGTYVATAGSTGEGVLGISCRGVTSEVHFTVTAAKE